MIDPVEADQVIISILENTRESRGVEFKPSLPWNDINQQIQLQDIIKSILGMSNVRDGGKIILGVKQNSDKTFSLEGMKQEDLETYDSDKIYQDVRNFGSPEPRFEVKNIKFDGKNFIVFFVHDFLYSPIICVKNGKNIGGEPLVRGVLYIRTLKPETKKIDDETEMREIIDLAIEKELASFGKRTQIILNRINPILSVSPNTTAQDMFQEELKDIPSKEIVDKIKSRGYWAINIHPELYNEQRLAKDQIREIVRKSVVSIFGWNYPHFHDADGDPYYIQNGIEKFVDWENMGLTEFWRMTQSANFLHLFTIMYDWREDAEHWKIRAQENGLTGNKLLGVSYTLYQVTQIFEFAKRLASQNIYDDKVVIEIKLYDLESRGLFVESMNRLHFGEPRISRSPNWELPKKIYTIAELLNDSNKYALEAFKDLVLLFNWIPSIDNISNDQQKFLQGKI